MIKRRVLDHLEKFEAFKVIADEGSLHRASRKLNLAQPSLSAKLKNLEDALDVQLLERSRKGVSLTPVGIQVLELTRELDTWADRVSDVLKQPNRGEKRVVRVGLYESIARYFWPTFFKRFTKQFPDVPINVTTGRSGELSERLLKSEIDLTITIEAPQLKGVDRTVLYSDNFSLFVSKNLTNSKAETYEAKTTELKQLPLISFSKAIAGAGSSIEQTLHKWPLDKINLYEVESFEIAHEFCLQGLGFAILPNKVAEAAFKKGSLQRVKVRGLTTQDFEPHDICLSVRNSETNWRGLQVMTHALLKNVVMSSQ